MKHLFIILYFLLLNSHVIGQENALLYQYETSSGIKWKTFGDEKVQPKYEGEIKNGIPYDKEYSLILMAENILGNGKMGK